MKTIKEIRIWNLNYAYNKERKIAKSTRHYTAFQYSVFICIHYNTFILTADDTLLFHIDIFTPKKDMVGISSNAISYQRRGDIIKTAIKMGHYATS